MLKFMAVIGDANPEMLAELAKGKDLIIDSTDNFETRLAINDISQKFRYSLDLWSVCRKLWNELYDYSWKNALS